MILGDLYMAQLKLALKRKGIYISLFFSTILAVLSLVSSYMSAIEQDISDVSCFIAQTFNNKNDFFWNLFILALPFLTALPFSFTSYEERKFGIEYYVGIRSKRNNDIIAKTMAAFSISFVIFLFVFLLDFLICYMVFPNNYNYFGSDLFDKNCMDYIYGKTVIVSAKYTGVFLKEIFLEEPVIYNFILFLIISLYAGLIAAVDYLFSFFCEKNMILIFLPGYLIQMIGMRMTFLLENFDTYINIDITSYMNLNIQYGRSLSVLCMLFIIMCLIIVILLFLLTRWVFKNRLEVY